jgi:flavin reductase (DIM6/NTAB) family NADH-FMN oxidoreductase RutF
VTARQGDQATGMLASWVQQCSFEPPQLTVCVKPHRNIADWLTEGAAFVVNVLGAGQKALIGHFARGFDVGEPAFTGLEVEATAEGVPVLAAALAWLDCRVAGRFEGGDHEVVVGRVVGGGLRADGAPYVHVRKNGLNY